MVSGNYKVHEGNNCRALFVVFEVDIARVDVVEVKVVEGYVVVVEVDVDRVDVVEVKVVEGIVVGVDVVGVDVACKEDPSRLTCVKFVLYHAKAFEK